MICEKYNCIFIHVPKTGGCSIEHVLDPNVKLDTYSMISRVLGNTELVDKHAKVEKYANSNQFKFAFVRNPWDWLVSYYKWMKLNRDLTTQDFKAWVKANPNPLPHSQHSYISVGGNVIVDFVGRFENLQEDFDKVCDKIGIPRKKLPHKNSSKYIKNAEGKWEVERKHYTEYYDDETKDIVSERYAKDIEYFGYKF